MLCPLRNTFRKTHESSWKPIKTTSLKPGDGITLMRIFYLSDKIPEKHRFIEIARSDTGRSIYISTGNHRRLCRVKNMLAMYLKYHKAGLTPTTPVTSIAISPVKMSIGRKSLTNLRSEMIFLQGKPVFYIFLPSTPPY